MKVNKKGQVTIWIIVALIIVVGVGLYFVFSNKTPTQKIPRELSPVYDYYEKCISQAGENALSIAGSQGGYIYETEYSPGSEYAPFSSHMRFLGFSIPFWFYLSGNGIAKEKVPSEREIETEISKYVGEEIRMCDFGEYFEQGFLINASEPEVKVDIQSEKVFINVKSKLLVSKGEYVSQRNEHKVEINSRFGKLYEEAKKIYLKEKNEAFLENYSVDVLRLYAPVDGILIECVPKIWKTREVVNELKEALSNNIAALRVGNKGEARDNKGAYFTIPFKKEVESINFYYNKNWPGKIEIYGAEQELMTAEPIGNQEGLGILGFCYIPYHFVYDVSFPVLVQLMDGEEIFQFPVVVVIDKNLPRNGIYNNVLDITGNESLPDFCEFPNKDITVRLFNKDLEPVDGSVSFVCFDQRCAVGNSKEGVVEGKVPACLNGKLEIKANGYSAKKILFSTNSERYADVILDREYNVNISLKIGGKDFEGLAFVSIKGPDFIRSVSFPDIREIKLSEGMYNVSVYAYSNSSLTIPSSKKTQCVDVVRSGILGLFGSTRQECIDIELPETKLDYALVGGGKGEIYLLESDLEKGRIVLDAEELPIPKTLEELQSNYQIFDELRVNTAT